MSYMECHGSRNAEEVFNRGLNWQAVVKKKVFMSLKLLNRHCSSCQKVFHKTGTYDRGKVGVQTL